MAGMTKNEKVVAEQLKRLADDIESGRVTLRGAGVEAGLGRFSDGLVVTAYPDGEMTLTLTWYDPGKDKRNEARDRLPLGVVIPKNV